MKRPKLTAAHEACGLTGYELKMERYADHLEKQIEELKQSDCISDISDLLKRYIGQVIASEGETFIPMDQIHPRSDEPRFTIEELDYLMRLADEFRDR